MKLSAVFKNLPAQISAQLIESLLDDYPRHDFHVRLLDGTVFGSARHPRFVIVLKNPRALRQMLLSPNELTLGEAYIFDDLDIQGDISAAFDLAEYLIAQHNRGFARRLQLASLLPKGSARKPLLTAQEPARLRGEVHSKDRDRQAISFHYDLPSKFFALWLDQGMVYSSAYFADGEETDLDTAQKRKLDYVCKKLRLRPGDYFLDIGCGWGGLLIHAATHYGAHALGITLSAPQAEVALQRISNVGLHDRCRVQVRDYRDLELDPKFDKIASIGMFEHVGEARLPEYFSRAWRLLRPGGVFLNSGIAAFATDHRTGPSFIERYVFPDGELVPLNTSLSAAERTGFEVRDVESLREHYALTLRHWVRRLEAHAEEARRITDETTYRIWRLYMAASEHRFLSARLNLYHVLLAKPLNGQSGMPWTRADWYE